MKLIEYLKETRGEMKHVSWPTRNQIVSYTLVVVLISIVTALFLGVFDFIFNLVIEQFIV